MRHPVAGVDGEIQHDTTHLTRVHVDRRQPLLRHDLQLDAIAECFGQHRREVDENGVQVALTGLSIWRREKASN